jgi:hypothetical protein
LSQKDKKGRKKVDEENELEVQSENFDLGRSLEQYDQLVHQLYHGENGRIYEVINVFNDKKSGKFTSTARAVIPQGEIHDIPDEILAINGVNGTMEKVNLMATGSKNRVAFGSKRMSKTTG